MDSEFLNTLRSLSTVFVMIAFAGVCWWAYAPRRKKRFEEAANLPFADDESRPDQEQHTHNSLKTAGQPEAGNERQEKS